jgi:hypothetical protein
MHCRRDVYEWVVHATSICALAPRHSVVVAKESEEKNLWLAKVSAGPAREQADRTALLRERGTKKAAPNKAFS